MRVIVYLSICQKELIEEHKDVKEGDRKDRGSNDESRGI